MSKSAVIIGGTRGIGLSMVGVLKERGYDNIAIIGRNKPKLLLEEGVCFYEFDLAKDDINTLRKFLNVDCLIISAGIGRNGLFKDLHEAEISKIIQVNSIATIKILNLFSDRLLSDANFYCGVITSIAGRVSSPLMAVYSASKAALSKYVEAVNAELSMNGSKNVITDISPGYINGTSFYGADTQLELLKSVSYEFLKAIENRVNVYIPDYENVYKKVLEDYSSSPLEFAEKSYEYKLKQNRGNIKSLIRVGYLSGTFDLFHIGHLNLLEKAKKYCDFLIVGVHKDASHKGKMTFIPFEERKRIVGAIGVVDKVVEARSEDSDAWEEIKYDYLFVGSDYKGTERFNKYEKYFEDKNVEIIYFPYTNGTSSTKLRCIIDAKLENN